MDIEMSTDIETITRLVFKLKTRIPDLNYAQWDLIDKIIQKLDMLGQNK
jgi:hypothetical protein